MNVELLEFTRRALEKGASREQIAQALGEAGWGAAEIRAAASAFADVAFPVPVPRPRPYLSAQEVFTYALFFTALYASALNLGALIFDFIDLTFPDKAARLLIQTRLYDPMRRNIATLVVAFPLFLFLFRAIHRQIARDPTKRESRPRKWLTYLTLFIAAAALIGDCSALVYSLLGGDLTIRFVLKVATVAMIAGGAFGYFLTDIRKDEAS
jgi:hypothetical protein